MGNNRKTQKNPGDNGGGRSRSEKPKVLKLELPGKHAEPKIPILTTTEVPTTMPKLDMDLDLNPKMTELAPEPPPQITPAQEEQHLISPAGEHFQAEASKPDARPPLAGFARSNFSLNEEPTNPDGLPEVALRSTSHWRPSVEYGDEALARVVENPPLPDWTQKLVRGGARNLMLLFVLAIFMIVFLTFSFSNGATGLLGRALFIATIACLLISIRSRNITLALIGITGAFATPFLQSLPGDSMFYYLVFLVLLDLNVLILLNNYDWKGLDYFTFAASIFYLVFLVEFTGKKIQSSMFIPFLTVIFLIFTVQFIVEGILRRKPSQIVDLAFLLLGLVLYIFALVSLTAVRAF